MRPSIRAIVLLAAVMAALPDASRAQLTLLGCEPTDACAFGGVGNNDRSVDPGEDVDTTIVLFNMGMTSFTNVTAVVSTGTPGVTITQANTTFGDIGGISSKPGMPPIEYSVDASVPCGTDIVLDIAITSDQGTFLERCLVSVPDPCTPCVSRAPDLQVIQCGASDSCPFGGPGNADGLIDPGETISATVAIRNAGGDATNVTAVVSSSTPGVTVTQPNTSFGNIIGGGVAIGAPPIVYTVDPTVPCFTDIVLDVALSSDQGGKMDSCLQAVNRSCHVCQPTPASLRIQGCATADACPSFGPTDGNGQVEPGETGHLTIQLQNTGSVDATNVSGTVTTGTPGVTITQGNTTFGTVAGFGLGSGVPSIDFDVLDTVPCGTDIVLDVAITSDQGTFDDECHVIVPSPCARCTSQPVLLALAGCGFGDACSIGGPGDRDGKVDPGEDGTLTVVVQNSGGFNATNVEVTVTSSTPGVTITQGTSTVGTVNGFGVAPGVPAVTFTVAPTVPCGTDLVFDATITSDQGTFVDRCTVTVPDPCNPCSPSAPVLRVASCAPTDTCSLGGAGNGDGSVDPGESVSLVVILHNFGGVNATGVSATATSSTPGVTITQGATTFGAVAPASDSGAGAPAIRFDVARTVACGTDIVLDFAITSDQGAFNGSCTVSIPMPCTPCVPNAPILVVEGCNHADSCSVGGPGGANGAVDPGENVVLGVEVRNAGGAAATGVSVTVTSATPGVTMTQGMAPVGTVPALATASTTTPLAYTVDQTVACGTELVFDVAIASDQGPFSDDCRVTVPMPCEPCLTSLMPPGEVPWLITRCSAADAFTIEWMPAPRAEVYDVHHGTIAQFRNRAMPYDHACVVKDLVAPLDTVLPTTTCGDGQSLYFLVVGRNAAGTGPYGLAFGNGNPARPPGASCP